MADRTQAVTPHLVVNDANAALDYYKKALGAKEVMRLPAEDGRRLMHSEIEVNGARIFVRDDFPEYAGGRRSAPKDLGGTTVTMHLEVPNCDAAVDRAVAAGATVVMPPMDAFWGARYAIVEDPDGIAVGLMSPISPDFKSVPPEV
jgi:PhnB protein